MIKVTKGRSFRDVRAHCAWPVCDGGSRASAMATRQSCCEFEIVPSLHLNLRGSSTIVRRFAATAACWGSGACAADLSKSAQPAHKSAIKKAKANRTRAAPDNAPAEPASRTRRRGATRCSSSIQRKLHSRVWTFNEVEASHLCCGRTNCYDIFRDARAKRLYMKKRQAAEAITTRGAGSDPALTPPVQTSRPPLQPGRFSCQDRLDARAFGARPIPA
jgi:hypothetical protein